MSGFSFSSFASKLTTAISEAADSLDAGKAQYLKERKEKDGGDFSEEQVDLPAAINPFRKLSTIVTPLFTADDPTVSEKDGNKDLETGQPRTRESSSGKTGDASGAGSVMGTVKSFFEWNATSNAASDPEALLPWVGAPNEEQVCEQILALSGDTRNLTAEPPEGTDFVFNLKESTPVAMAMLEYDERLKQQRFDLVPRRLKDDIFWRNYFYRIHVIKRQMILESMNAPTPSKSVPLSTKEEKIDESIQNEANKEASDKKDITVLKTECKSPAPTAIESAIRKSTPDKATLESIASSLDAALDNVDVTAADVDAAYGSDWEKELEAEIGELDLDL